MTSLALRFDTLQPSRQDVVAETHQAMLYAAGVPDRESMKKKPQVGVASVWWEGNPCKYVYLGDRGLTS